MCYLLLLCCFGEFGLGVDLGVVSLLVFFVMMMMMMMVVVVMVAMEYYIHVIPSFEVVMLRFAYIELFSGLIGREREREKMGYLFLAYYRGDFLTLSTLSFYIRLWT